MKTVWINKVRKREVKSGYKILSLEIQSVDTLEEEQEERRKRWEEARKQEEQRRAEQKARRIAQLQQQRADVQSELASLKGLFTGKRRREIEAQLAQIEKELKGLN